MSVSLFLLQLFMQTSCFSSLSKDRKRLLRSSNTKKPQVDPDEVYVDSLDMDNPIVKLELVFWYTPRVNLGLSILIMQI